MQYFQQAVEQADESPANLIHAKWHIPERDRVTAGTKMKKLYSRKSFSDDFSAFVSVSITSGW